MLKVRKGKFANVLEASIKEAWQQKAVSGGFSEDWHRPIRPNENRHQVGR